MRSRKKTILLELCFKYVRGEIKYFVFGTRPVKVSNFPSFFTSLEKFESLTALYCRGANAALIVYDMTDKSSFDNLQKHYEMVKLKSPNCFIIFVGSKYDLIEEKYDRRSVSFEDMKQWYQRRVLFFFFFFFFFFR
eukprot:TRINITY_DN2975_c0_g1_i3.p1 TRINITY_DN2975_c0_g1~~TRINITY_DN2975_c0_g1_i3.p1  ORF type:complete len:136 (+),score=27.70 TRINITY_DN2975_c0_g1_i3:98-505(+)